MTQKKFKLYPGSRKAARATATIMQGTGRIRINKVPVEHVSPKVAMERIRTPLEIAGDVTDNINIDVVVKGGGFMGQAEAAAMAISRALVGHVRGNELRKTINEFDKHLLSGDSRTVEPKKFGGPKARRKKHKSYR